MFPKNMYKPAKTLTLQCISKIVRTLWTLMSFAVVCGLEPVDFTDIFRVISPLQGVVSLTFRELSKIISRKYTMPEIKFMLRISSWNFLRVPKAWAHVQSFSLKYDFNDIQISTEYFWELAKR